MPKQKLKGVCKSTRPKAAKASKRKSAKGEAWVIVMDGQSTRTVVTSETSARVLDTITREYAPALKRLADS